MDKLLNWLNEKMLPFLVTVILVFIPLYPKLPLVGVTHTWVYVRWEDFLIALAVGIWLLLFMKKKIALPKTISLPIGLYWLVGLMSTVFGILFIFPHLANVFPNVAIFNYLRRIEYLILLPVAFSTIRKKEDVYKYVLAMGIAVLGVVLYGLGQKFGGFPAYLTMNEEFAKGVPLYLPSGARITSTFGGHYDLAAYLVIAIALLGSLIFGVRSFLAKVVLLLLCVGSLVVLLLTASRVSFAVYLMTVSLMLVLQKKKWLIIPTILVSIFFLLQVSGTAERFAKTIRVQSVVYNTQTGQPIAVLENLPPEISGIRPKPTPQDTLPLGTGFIALPPISSQAPEATNVATIRRPVSTTLKISSLSSEISTISGSFLIQKAFVYDISFTTRFQGEWPRAWKAFLTNPFLGTGYSSIGLATDGDYLRFLGETGILGFLAFLFIFLAYYVLVKRRIANVKTPLARSFVLGVTAAIFGLFLNAVLIDVFEASKVAFILWPLLGISIGILALYEKEPIDLWGETKRIILSSQAIGVYLLLLTFFIYGRIFNYYFVGDDFTWLRWAAQAKLSDLLGYFSSASGFFYRPLPKLLYFVTYAFFWLKPFGYHLMSLVIYFSLSVLVYFLGRQILKNGLFAFLAAIVFLFLPINAESVIWISSYSGMLMTLFVLASFVSFVWFAKSQRWFYAILVVGFFGLGLLSHEGAVILPVLVIWYELVNNNFRFTIFAKRKVFFALLILELLGYFVIRRASGALVPSGDYNYNISHLPFNFLGNLAGYLSVGYFGSFAIPIYDSWRANLRQDKFIVLGLAAILLFILASTRKFWQKVFNRAVLLVLGLAVISLLPYLGLGNLSERYGLLASVFLSILLLMIIIQVIESLVKNQLFLTRILTLVFVATLLVWYKADFEKTSLSWEKASDISHKIIYAVKDNYRFFPKNATLFFVNVPIRLERAWVFPVGLSDAMWFVYRDKTMKVVRTNSLEEAMTLGKSIEAKVFVFENGELKEVFFK